MNWSLACFTLRRRALSQGGAVVATAALLLLAGSFGVPVALGQQQHCQLIVTMRNPAEILELQVYAGPRWSSLVSNHASGPVADTLLPTSNRTVFPLRCGTYVVVPVLTESGILAGSEARPRPVALDGPTTLALPVSAGSEPTAADPS